jgi:hypothetical protein
MLDPWSLFISFLLCSNKQSRPGVQYVEFNFAVLFSGCYDEAIEAGKSRAALSASLEE